MARTALTHNPANGVTAGIWAQGDDVVKRLTHRRETSPEWAASDDPRHWNYWRREAAVYRSGLPERIGLAAPRALSVTETAAGDLELRLERVAGRTGDALDVGDLETAALALGRAQGRSDLPDEPWLSRRFLRDYSGSRPARWELLHEPEAWAAPLVREHFDASARERLVRMCAQRERLLRLSEALPRTLCHLDVWPPNLIRRADGEVVFLDWAFAGDGALGEDVGNLVPDAVFDELLPHERIDELDERLTAAYLRGLRASGWAGDERVVRLGICAAAVKYDWLVVRTLEQARAERLVGYGGAQPVAAPGRFAARAAGLRLCARWAAEAERLADELGMTADPAPRS